MVRFGLRSLFALAVVMAVNPVCAPVFADEPTSYGYGLTSSNTHMPQNLTSMEAVRERYGAPKLERPAVGEPPITRWEYGTGTVYFEGNLVISSVPLAASINNQ